MSEIGIQPIEATLRSASSAVVPPQAAASAPSLWYSKRIPELDGLRGLAILQVLIYHYFYQTVSGGDNRWFHYLKDACSVFWSGVDLFFVLSGFLIGGILLDARRSPNYFRAFYTRRVFRIIPVYTVLIAIFYVCWATGVPGRIAASDWLFRSTIPWYAYATFTQNIRYAVGEPASPTWISVTWSLAIEEQFYLMLPAVILYSSRRRLPYLLGGAILAAPLLRILLNLTYSHGTLASFFLMPCRADALLLGVSVALLVREPSLWGAMKSHRGALASLWAVLLAGFPLFILFKETDQLRSFWMSTIGFSWLAVFYVGLLMLALMYSDGWLGRILRFSWLRSLGAISYGLYLIQWLVLGLIFAVLRSKSPWAETSTERGLVLLSLALAIAAASISWNFFEKPLLKIGHRVRY
jgi:peptidoglycan/LPS O-acetylase OafA/YrhL